MSHRASSTGTLFLLGACSLSLFLWRGELNAQATDLTTGAITTSQWLVLGPFREPFGCNNNNDSILGNHIWPSCIGCQYPEEGDEIDYDPSQAVATYVGPQGDGGGPVWRAFDDGSDDGDQNLDGDVMGDLSLVMSWMVTYVENKGDEAAVVELCVGSDDGVQVWLDDTIVHNNNACRGRAFCQDTVGVLIDRGLHRFAIAAWENGGGWGLSLAMRVNGVPVVDDGSFPDWTFRGREGGAELKNENCECQDPVVVKSRITGFACNKNAAEGVDLAWTNPPDSDPGTPITIYVNGKVHGTVPGDATSATINKADLPDPKPIFCVMNDSGLPSCCGLRVTNDAGFILSNHWLALGPFTNSFGCNNNHSSILGNHIAPSDFKCQYPLAGDEIEYDPELAVSTDYVGLRSAAGKPYWRQLDDGSPNADIDFDLDFGRDLSDVVTFAATYIEYLGVDPVDVQFCVGSDDGVQVWINDQVAHNNNACRGRGTCQDIVPVTIKPGFTRLIIAAWERGGGWGCSLAIQLPDGTPVVDGDASPDWKFHGSKRPPNFPTCDVLITRDIEDTLINGTTGLVRISLEPRKVGVVVLNEVLPPGLSAANPSNGGILAGDTITWNLGRLEQPLVLSYTMTAAKDAADGVFPSTATLDGAPLWIFGDSYTGSPITPDGFIKQWNHLGPLAYAFPVRLGDHGPPGACDGNAGADLVLDWIVNLDRSISEASALPFPGMVTRPDYGSPTGARAAGLVIEPGDSGAVVRDRAPVWKGSSAAGDTIDHATPFVHGFDADDHLTLSCVYVTNTTAADINALAAFGSDDAIQIFVNETDITLGGILECRAYGLPGEIQNTAPATLKRGENRVLVKVADGTGGSGFRLRFHADANDPLSPPLLPPQISISLESAANPRPGSVVRSFAKGSYGLGESVEVSLEANLKAAAALVIREALPAGATASAISDGGRVAAGAIEWTLPGVTRKTVTYTLSAEPCLGTIQLVDSTFRVGIAEAAVTGASSIARAYKDEALGSWSNRDLGTTGGSAQRIGERAVFAAGTGAGLKGVGDQFRFISTPARGEFTFTARIDCFDDPDRRGTAGVLARASDDPGAAFIHLHLTAVKPTTGGVGTLRANFRRDQAKSATAITVADKDVLALPIWLQIQKTGGKAVLRRSADGVTYTELGSRDIGTGLSQLNLPDDVLLGLGVASGTSDLARASFSEVSGPSFIEAPGKRFRRGDINSDGKLDVTDPVNLLGFLFLGQGKPACLDAGDTDDDGKADISDAVSSLGYQFLGGVAPAAPGPTVCGLDAKAEDPDLGCDTGCP